DGIRDFHVTGVQTCALPISTRSRRARSKVSSEPCGIAWRWPPFASRPGNVPSTIPPSPPPLANVRLAPSGAPGRAPSRRSRRWCWRSSAWCRGRPRSWPWWHLGSCGDGGDDDAERLMSEPPRDIHAAIAESGGEPGFVDAKLGVESLVTAPRDRRMRGEAGNYWSIRLFCSACTRLSRQNVQSAP